MGLHNSENTITAHEVHGQPEKIRQMFARIATRYDFTNSALSLGLHWYWKKKFVSAALKACPNPKVVLDCACGSGDISLLFLKKNIPVVLPSDYCIPMMEAAQIKRATLHFHGADITRLPYASECSDILTISFGIRNVPDRNAAFREILRVLKPGGLFAVLEFGQPTNSVLRRCYQLFSEKFLPIAGGLLTGETGAYSYLHESSVLFPSGSAFCSEVLSTSSEWENIQTTPIFNGICWLYLFKKAHK